MLLASPQLKLVSEEACEDLQRACVSGPQAGLGAPAQATQDPVELTARKPHRDTDIRTDRRSTKIGRLDPMALALDIAHDRRAAGLDDVLKLRLDYGDLQPDVHVE